MKAIFIAIVTTLVVMTGTGCAATNNNNTMEKKGVDYLMDCDYMINVWW